MSENFSKKLSQVKAPQVGTPTHKRKLKNALLNRVYLNKDKTLRRSNLFDDLKNMSLKKLIPSSVLAIFVFTIMGQNFLSWRNTAYAQELINETIHKIESEPLTEEDRKTMSMIQILEEMKKEGQLKYLGEEVHPILPERKTKKFSFTDEDLSNDLIISVTNDEEIYLMIDTSLGQIMSEDFEIKFGDHGKVTNLEELKDRLKDPNLNKPWIKELIKINNLHWLKNMYASKDERPDENNCSPKTQDVVNQLEPLIRDAEVSIQGTSGGCGPKEDFSFRISLFTVSGQKNKTTEAQSEIQKIIEKLSDFETETAQYKIEILKKAMNSDHLRSYPNTDNTLFSFPYIGAGDDEELLIRIEAENETENFVTFSFVSEGLFVIPGKRGEWIDVKVKDGKVVNLDYLEEKLNDPNLNDELLEMIIHEQNTAMGGYIEADMNQSEKQYMDTPPNKVQVQQLKELLEKANVLVLESGMMPADVMNGEKEFIPENTDPNILYSLAIYPLGNPTNEKTSESVNKLEIIIAELKQNINAGNQSTIDILKQALKADGLRYKGEEKWGEETVQKISFTDEDLDHDLTLVIRENGDVLLLTESFLGQDLYQKFDLKVDEEGGIQNIRELEEALNDPNLNKPWLKSLVQKTNADWINIMQDLEKQNQWEEGVKVYNERILKQIEGLNQKSTVIIRSLVTEFRGQKTPLYHIELYAITGQKAQKAKAKAEIERMMSKLSEFKTHTAEIKIDILEKALKSKKLRVINIPNLPSMLSFPYNEIDQEQELYMIEHKDDETEKFLELTFSHPYMNGREKEVDLEIKDGKIINVKEIKDKLSNPKLIDPLLSFIIQEQNEALYKKFKNENLMIFMAEPKVITPKILSQLKQIFKDAQVPIMDLITIDARVVLLHN